MKATSPGDRRPQAPIVIPARVAERAASRYIEDESGCWISTYSTGSHGYAQIGWVFDDGRTMTTAHRAAWVHYTGRQISEGITIDHTCWERRCVNPWHLRDLPNYENARRTSGRDWPLGECIRGHSNDLLVRDATGKRICAECRRQWGRTANARKRRAALAETSSRR